MNTLKFITRQNWIRPLLITAAIAATGWVAGCDVKSMGEALIADQEGKNPNTAREDDTSSNNNNDSALIVSAFLVGDWELESGEEILTFGEDGGLGDNSGKYISRLDYDSTRWSMGNDAGVLFLLGLICSDDGCSSYETADTVELKYELLDDKNTLSLLRLADADDPDAKEDVWTRWNPEDGEE